MKTVPFLLVAALGVLALVGAGPSPGGEGQSKCCQLVQDALQASRRIKIGETRRQLETDFREDGGAQVRDQTRYMYRRCSYIRVDVDFKLAAPVDSPADSPDDTVVKVSRPYLAYPTMD
jgi:hypothetical protein